MIQTQDQLTAAMAGQIIQSITKIGATMPAAGNFYSRWANTGRPGAGAAPSVGLNGEAVDASFAGAVPYSNAASGKQKYLSGLDFQSNTAGVHLLCDRLWQNSGIVVTTTTAQAITAVPIHSRDLYGAANGTGVEAWLDVYTAIGNGANVNGATISYTNESGIAGRTGTISTIPATSVAGTAIQITMQSGDSGVRSIESITLGTSLVSGSVGLVLRRRLASINVSVANQGDFRNFFDIGQKLWNGMAMEVLTLVVTTTAQNLFGSVSVVEG